MRHMAFPSSISLNGDSKGLVLKSGRREASGTSLAFGTENIGGHQGNDKRPKGISDNPVFQNWPFDIRDVTIELMDF